MNNRHFNDRLLLSIVLVCCYPQIWCGLVVKGQAAKNINFTNTNTELVSKLKTTTSVTTTAKPELETTTLNLDIDGRSAFINNQFVADDEIATSYNSTPLHDLLQKQMLTQDNFHYYTPDSPQMRKTLENANMEIQKPPNKPIFNYNLGQFDDYEEEETSEYGSDSGDTLENCEDTQESVDGANDQIAELIHEEERNIFEQSVETKQLTNNPEVLNVYNNKNKVVNESNNVDLQTNTKQGLTHAHDYVPQSVYGTVKLTKQQPPYKGNNDGIKSGHTAEPLNLYNTHNNYGQIIEKQPQQHPFNQYLQAKPLEHQNPYDRSKPQIDKNSHYYIRTTTSKPTQNSKLQIKPMQNVNNKSLYNSNYTKASIVPLPNNSYNNMVALSVPNYNYNTSPTSSYTSGSSNTLNPSLMPNFSYGNYNKENSSPFSTIVGQSKKYRTVSSSTQYVSTPFADLVFKYSIGMAKHLNSKVGNNSDDNQAQIFHVLNDVDAKTE